MFLLTHTHTVQLTLCDPMDCSPSGSVVHGILQERILEWVSMPSSKGSSWLRDWTSVSCLLHWQVGSLALATTIHTHTHTHTYIYNVLFRILFHYHKILNIVPWATISLLFVFLFGCTGSSLPFESAFSGCSGRGGALLVAVLQPLIVVASLVVEHRLSGTQTSVDAALGLCSWGSQG